MLEYKLDTGALTTGTRVMHREYDSLLFDMIDQPQAAALELQIKVAVYMDVMKWKPCVSLTEK